MLSDNFKEVEKKIQAACDRVKRKRSEVTLIAVSKTKPNSMIEEAISLGYHIFGENKVQELLEKQETIQLPTSTLEHLQRYSIKWHMIGHLQRNKVKYIVDKVSLIHSVDSFRLAEQISIDAEKKDITVPVLIEVNAAEEESKFGVKLWEAEELIRKIAQLPHIVTRGLMTIAPFVEDQEENREIFRKMRNLYVDIKSKNIDNVTIDILSMGMTNDYETAIEEGSTMVRIGTGIFGDR